MPEHTPGPWKTKIVDYGDMKQVEAIVSPTAAYTPRDTFFVVTPGAISGRSLTECDANGRLIAAAPDMFNALMFIMADAELTVTDAREMATAAIAKAKGALHA